MIAIHITVEVRHQYGNQVFYPADENAKRVASISGTDTLPRRVLENIKAMGIQIVVIQPKVTV
jgi:hypothetical protein